jgi:hypothetical protein
LRELRGAEIACFGGVVAGALVGGFVTSLPAALIDDIFLGKVPIESPRRESRSGATAVISPYVDPNHDAFGLSVSGTF